MPRPKHKNIDDVDDEKDFVSKRVVKPAVRFSESVLFYEQGSDAYKLGKNNELIQRILEFKSIDEIQKNSNNEEVELEDDESKPEYPYYYYGTRGVLLFRIENGALCAFQYKNGKVGRLEKRENLLPLRDEYAEDSESLIQYLDSLVEAAYPLKKLSL